MLIYRLISFDCLTEIVKFFGQKEIEKFDGTSLVLFAALAYNPVVSGERFVQELSITFCPSKKIWLTDVGPISDPYCPPLPLTKPPPTILGFADVFIEFSGYMKLHRLKVCNCKFNILIAIYIFLKIFLTNLSYS